MYNKKAINALEGNNARDEMAIDNNTVINKKEGDSWT